MGMENVLFSFRALCEMPLAWVIVAAVILKVVWSLVHYYTCPVLCQAPDVDPRLAREKINARFFHSPRFLVLMLTGIALSIAGLYAMRSADLGALGLAALVLGVFILIVEPSQLSVLENTFRVSAARIEGTETHALALERLRAAHVERIAIEVVLAVMVTALFAMA
jgi:hypothetical protein